MPSPAHFQFEFQCAPQCNRGPFTSIQGTNRHRNSCSIWSAHVKAQARKRGHEELEVGGEDEDPVIARRRNLERQRRRRREDEKKKRKIQTDEVEAGEAGMTIQDENTRIIKRLAEEHPIDTEFVQ